MVETTHRQSRRVVLCVRWSSSNFDCQVGRSGKTLLLLATGLRPRGEGNGSQVFIDPMLTVRRLISLTVALAAGLARATDLDASIDINKHINQYTSRSQTLQREQNHI